MKIYHYTTIDTLALILKNKTIRFNRLDQVDDKEEYIYGSGEIGLKLSKYVFVSCWTKKEVENILLWERCGNNHGVRIGLDENMFIAYDTPWNIKSFFPCIINPMKDCVAISFQNEIKIYDIEYVPSPKKVINDAIKNQGNGMSMYYNEIGKYKGLEWRAQDECRFKIHVIPMNLSNINNDISSFELLCAFMDSMRQSVILNKDISLPYIDIPIKQDKLNQIEVMVAPKTSESEKERVKKMLKSYPESKFLISRIDGMIANK